MKKKLMMALSLVLVAALSIGGTIAYLTDKTEAVENTFTVGNVDITLEETWNTDTDGENGNDAWSAKLMPGQTYDKDPTVTVTGGSEACWLFVKVEKSPNLGDFVDYSIDTAVWTELESGVYYKAVSAETADQEFNVLTDDQVTIFDTVTNEDMKEIDDELTLTFTAYAIQQAGFDLDTKTDAENAAAAWAEVSDAAEAS